jgi:hypothetical protein
MGDVTIIDGIYITKEEFFGFCGIDITNKKSINEFALKYGYDQTSEDIDDMSITYTLSHASQINNEFTYPYSHESKWSKQYIKEIKRLSSIFDVNREYNNKTFRKGMIITVSNPIYDDVEEYTIGYPIGTIVNYNPKDSTLRDTFPNLPNNDGHKLMYIFYDGY